MSIGVCEIEMPSDLRERAEKMIQGDIPDLEYLSLPEIRGIIHDFQVHAAELKLQNEVLRQACDERTRQNEESRRLLEKMPDIIARFDRNLNLLYANSAFERVTGVSREQAIGRPLTDLEFPFVNNDALKSCIRQAFERNSEAAIEFEYTGSQGQRVYRAYALPEQNEQERPEQVTIIAHDISDLVDAREKLRESEEQLNAFFGFTPARVTILDEDLRFVRVNKTSESVFGFSQEDIVGKCFRDLVPDFALIIEEEARKVLESGDPILNHDVSGVFPGHPGEVITWITSYFPLPLPGGKKGVGIVAMDISDRKRAEEELQETHEELEEQVWRRTVELEKTIEKLRGEIAEREQARQTIRENEKLLSTVLDTLPVGVMVLDREGRVIRINPASQHIWGKTKIDNPDEFEKSNEWRSITGEIIPVDQRAATRARMTGATILDEEIEIVDSDGNQKIILNSAAPLKDENGTIYGAIMLNEDVTDRKKADLELQDYRGHLEELVNERTLELEEANSRLKREIEERKQIEKTLRESEEKFRIALKNAPINMVIQDRNRRHTWVYDAQSRLKIEDIYGKKEEDIFPSEEAARLIEIKERVMATGIGERVELPLTVFGIETVYLDITIEPLRDNWGEVIGVVSVNLNITERKRAEEELRQSEIRFRAAVDNFPGVFLVYDSERRIQFVNRVGVEKSGHTREEIIGHCDEEVYPQSVINAYMPSLLRAIETREQQTLEAHLSPDGEYWVLMSIVPLSDERGDIWQILVISYDITSRKHAEDRAKELNIRLRKQTAQLEATNKELEAFSYSISHDLRAPLRTLDGFSLALLEDYSDRLDAEGKDYLNRIRAAATRMARLIDDLLQLSRTTRAEIHFTTVNLSAQAQSVLEELHQEDPGRKVETVIQKGITAEGDETLLRQVMQNLLGNAWKFTSHVENARIEFGEMPEDGKRIFFVRDNGAGFDMKYIDKLFIPFRRLHSESEFSGTGIGLSIVKRIIDRHGGRIWAESEPSKGATFYFSLEE